jgi:hypothetical protein
MEITRGKSRQIWCTIERIKQHHEDHKHKSFSLTPSLLLDFTYNLKHEIRFVRVSKVSQRKVISKKGEKMACVKPYEKM